MSARVKIVLLGTGHMGAGIGTLILKKKGMVLAGAVGRRKERAGRDLGEIFNLETRLDIPLSADLDKLLKATRPDLLIQSTCSRLKHAWPEIETTLRNGVNVISIAEEMSYPWHSSNELAEKINSLAVEHGVTVLGTGINPGFVLDYLIIALTSVCLEVDSITASRVNDLSPYGPSVLKSQGVGLTPEDFERGIADGSVMGHFGFPESISMIAGALGWKISRIEQTRKPIVSKVKRESPVMTIDPGYTAGCEHTAIGYINDRAVITLIHPQQVYPYLEGVATGDHIMIKGIPAINFSGSPEIPGGMGTVALAVNMVPRVLKAKPGLATMADLPVPAALLGDIREMMRR